jgi:hypothetical protein
MNMMPVPPLSAGLLGLPRRQLKPGLAVSGEQLYRTVIKSQEKDSLEVKSTLTIIYENP